MNHLHDPQLSVARISKELDCSADCEYLSKTPLNVNQTAKEVDFSATGYFIKVLKKQMNQAPKNYRDIHKTI